MTYNLVVMFLPEQMGIKTSVAQDLLSIAYIIIYSSSILWSIIGPFVVIILGIIGWLSKNPLTRKRLLIGALVSFVGVLLAIFFANSQACYGYKDLFKCLITLHLFLR